MSVSGFPDLDAWLIYGERGLSSDTIVWHLTGKTHPGRPYPPYDPADFRRCELLLRQVPLLRPMMPKMAEVDPTWAALVKQWKRIANTMEREIPGCFTTRAHGEAPKAYALIKKCRDAS